MVFIAFVITSETKLLANHW